MEDFKENPRLSLKLVVPVSIKDTPLLQYHNPVFNLQDSPSHKKSEDSIIMVEGGEHPNAEKPMNTQELKSY